MSELEPVRESPLHSLLATSGACFELRRGMMTATAFGDLEHEREAVRRLAVCDLSSLPRAGFAGKEVTSWLQRLGLSLPDRPDKAIKQKDGGLVVRLGVRNFLILSDVLQEENAVVELEGAWNRHAHSNGVTKLCGDLYAWIALCGAKGPEAMAKLCAVDLRPHRYVDLSVAQTRIADVNGVIIRWDLAGVQTFHLLVEWSLARYVWNCLMDAAREYDVVPVGSAAVSDGVRAQV